MKRKERDQARVLRKRGVSIGNIAKELGVSKASVSLWVRDIRLSSAQRQTLSLNGFSIDAIEKRRINRIANTEKRHQVVIDAARGEISSLSSHDSF